MVRLKRGRKKKESPLHSNSQHYPEFFRIYLPEHNSKTLCIPPAFIANFNGKIPKKFILRNSHGKSWHLESEDIGGKLLIKKGWECFVSSHSLVRGDFLIFQYNGNGLFIIKVFGLDGCKKDETTVIGDQLDVKVEEARSEQVASDLSGTCELKNSKRGMVVEHGHPGGGTEQSHNNIRFSKVLGGKRRYDMGIPLGIIDEHKINPPELNTPENIVLRNLRGDYLPAIFRRRPDRRVDVGRGWRDFCMLNDIYQGDELEFEIILDKQRKVREIVLLHVNHRRRRDQTFIAR